jgi:GH24 family phage-related lysozyme (muramidase)
MLTADERAILKANIEKYEGKVPHMYLDSRGFVTVGVGHLLNQCEDAQKLPFQKADGSLASQENIAEDFKGLCEQEGNRVASYYKEFTSIVLDDAAIDALTEKHIDSFHQELKIVYDGFDMFPSDVRLALFDLIFNLGMTGLRKKWPKLNACIAAKDWLGAAENCRRKGIADARNDYVRELLARGGDTSIA